MTRPLFSLPKLALVTGLCLSLAAPARAGDDAAKVLAGLLGVALLGAAISHIADGDGQAHVVTHPPHPAHPPHPVHPVHPRPLPDHVKRYVVPRKCLRSKPYSQTGDMLLGRVCVQQNVVHGHKLPKSCEVRYWSHKHTEPRRGYTLNCLETYGYRLARH